MEGHGIGVLFQELKDAGMNVIYHIQDGDASSRKSVKVVHSIIHFPHLCSECSECSVEPSLFLRKYPSFGASGCHHIFHRLSSQKLKFLVVSSTKHEI